MNSYITSSTSHFNLTCPPTLGCFLHHHCWQVWSRTDGGKKPTSASSKVAERASYLPIVVLRLLLHNLLHNLTHKHGAPTPPSSFMACPSCLTTSQEWSLSSTLRSHLFMQLTRAAEAAPQHWAHASRSPHARRQQPESSEGISSSCGGAEPNDLRCSGGGTDWAAKNPTIRLPSEPDGGRVRGGDSEALRDKDEGRGESMAESTEREDGQRVRDWEMVVAPYVPTAALSCHAAVLPYCPVPLCPNGPSSTLLRMESGEDAETGMESRCMPFGGTSKVLAGGITATNWCPSGLGPWISILVLLTHSPCQVSTYRMDCRMRDLVASSLLMMRGDAVRAPAGRCA
ncbi:hypothetical protein V8C26DRAFT_387027 [Trichoderma gracile]